MWWDSLSEVRLSPPVLSSYMSAGHFHNVFGLHAVQAKRNAWGLTGIGASCLWWWGWCPWDAAGRAVGPQLPRELRMCIPQVAQPPPGCVELGWELERTASERQAHSQLPWVTGACLADPTEFLMSRESSSMLQHLCDLPGFEAISSTAFLYLY